MAVVCVLLLLLGSSFPCHVCHHTSTHSKAMQWIPCPDCVDMGVGVNSGDVIMFVSLLRLLCCVVCVVCTVGDVPAGQKQALVDFWNALDGPNWNLNGPNWNLTLDPCTGAWLGIQCDADNSTILYVIHRACDTVERVGDIASGCASRFVVSSSR